MNMQRERVGHNQKGFASIVIALTMLIVMALMTIGFAQLARREQQNALDKHLATQAYYAAESGINDIVAEIPAISAAADASPASVNPHTCLDPATYLHGGDVNATTGAAITCAIVDLRPPNIVFGAVSPDTNRTVTFTTTKQDGTPGALSSFTVSWGSNKLNAPNFPAATSTGLEPLSVWQAASQPAVIQFSITPLGSLQRDDLIANTYTVYLYPAAGGSNVANYAVKNQDGTLVSGDCSGSNGYTCNVKFTNLGGAPGEGYVVHMANYYDESNISINTASDGTNTLDFKSGQVQVDVTAKARNVLKRLQVRKPFRWTTGMSALEAQDICKRLKAEPNSTQFDTPAGYNATDCDVTHDW